MARGFFATAFSPAPSIRNMRMSISGSRTSLRAAACASRSARTRRNGADSRSAIRGNSTKKLMPSKRLFKWGAKKPSRSFTPRKIKDTITPSPSSNTSRASRVLRSGYQLDFWPALADPSERKEHASRINVLVSEKRSDWIALKKPSIWTRAPFDSVSISVF